MPTTSRTYATKRCKSPSRLSATMPCAASAFGTRKKRGPADQWVCRHPAAGRFRQKASASAKKPSVNEMAALPDIPDKHDGMDASQIEVLAAAGQLDEIASFCLWQKMPET